MEDCARMNATKAKAGNDKASSQHGERNGRKQMKGLEVQSHKPKTCQLLVLTVVSTMIS